MPSAAHTTRSAVLTALVAAVPTLASAQPATPLCADLASNPAWGLAGNPAVTGLTIVNLPGA